MTDVVIGALIEQFERADAPTRQLFEQAFFVCFGPVCRGDDDAMTRWIRFSRLVDAEAWIDAAIMLIPDGWGGTLGLGKSGLTWLWRDGRGRDKGVTAPGKKPPGLALGLAALKAHTPAGSA